VGDRAVDARGREVALPVAADERLSRRHDDNAANTSSEYNSFKTRVLNAAAAACGGGVCGGGGGAVAQEESGKFSGGGVG
jgi:hypothetical protein